MKMAFTVGQNYLSKTLCKSILHALTLLLSYRFKIRISKLSQDPNP